MLHLSDLTEIYKLFGSGVVIGLLVGAMLFFLSYILGFFYNLFKRL